MRGLAGRGVLVSGGSSGIGLAAAARFLEEGSRVFVAGLDPGEVDAAVAGLRDHGEVSGMACDVSREADVARLAAAADAALGGVDVLANNAGTARRSPFLSIGTAEWDRIIAVNLRGTLTVTRVVLDGMVERGTGRIIHIASDAGRVGSSGEVVYSATKGGVIAFGKALAREVARHQITVNTVCPGPTDTALLGQVAAYSQKMVEATVRAIPLRRVAVPAEIASVVTFLATDDAAYMTGQTVSVSGGLTML